jgi:hypothetical protein
MLLAAEDRAAVTGRLRNRTEARSKEGPIPQLLAVKRTETASSDLHYGD